MPQYPQTPDLAKILKDLSERVAKLEAAVAQLPKRAPTPPP